MIHQPPAGARDLLPLEVVQKSWINDRLQVVFQKWGYERIVTSTLEWMETLTAGGAIAPGTVISIQNTTEGALGLRPELTTSIARAAVTRMANGNSPQRICYRANVFRNPPPGYHGRQVEFHQAGVELLFVGGVLVDAEILLLLADSLADLGLKEYKLILGEAGLTQVLLSVFPPDLRQQVRHKIATLDYVGLEKLAYPSDALRERALFLFNLRGNPVDVLEKVAQLALDEAGQQKVSNLKTLIELLTETCPHGLSIVLDLSLLQTFDYYTGIVFKVLHQDNNQLRVLGQGGRYDELLQLYHPQQKAAPGIGFSFNLEALHLSLLQTPQLPQSPPPIDWLVVAKTPEAQAKALIYAQNLRNSQDLIRVELELGERTPDEIRESARQRQIGQIAWISSEGTASVE